MTQQQTTRTPERHEHSTGQHPHQGGAGHRWMMIACCIPMIATAVILVAIGVAGAGFLLAAVMCTLMMALMMVGGHGGHGGAGRGE